MSHSILYRVAFFFVLFFGYSLTYYYLCRRNETKDVFLVYPFDPVAAFGGSGR